MSKACSFQGPHGLDVGDKLRAKLVSVNVEKGYIYLFSASPKNNYCKKKCYSVTTAFTRLRG